MDRNFETMHSILIDQTREILDNYGFSADNFLKISGGEKSVSCNDEILGIIAECGYNWWGMDHLQQINYEFANKLIREYADKVSEDEFLDNRAYRLDPKWQVSRMLHDYFNTLHKEFFLVNDGKVIKTDIEKINLPSRQKENEKLSNNEKVMLDVDYLAIKNKHKHNVSGMAKELELLIMKDGEIYFAPNGHEALATWLNLSGVDIQNAVRIEAVNESYATSKFGFGSIYNHNYSVEERDDKVIELTDAQGEAIGSIHRALNILWQDLEPINESIKKSSGFGLSNRSIDVEGTEQFPDRPRKNLNTLYYNVDGVDRREINLKIDSLERFDHTLNS